MVARVAGERIEEASYETYGCPAAVACASLTAQIIKGRTISQALALTVDDLVLIVGGLPPGKEYVATLCIEAVQRALSTPGEES